MTPFARKLHIHRHNALYGSVIFALKAADVERASSISPKAKKLAREAHSILYELSREIYNYRVDPWRGLEPEKIKRVRTQKALEKLNDPDR